VKKDPTIQKYFAFVCFAEASQAEAAYNFLESNSIFGSVEAKDKIYVNWA
jgi:RNA recognition motif-containing protein